MRMAKTPRVVSLLICTVSVALGAAATPCTLRSLQFSNDDLIESGSMGVMKTVLLGTAESVVPSSLVSWFAGSNTSAAEWDVVPKSCSAAGVPSVNAESTATPTNSQSGASPVVLIGDLTRQVSWFAPLPARSTLFSKAKGYDAAVVANCPLSGYARWRREMQQGQEYPSIDLAKETVALQLRQRPGSDLFVRDDVCSAHAKGVGSPSVSGWLASNWILNAPWAIVHWIASLPVGAPTWHESVIATAISWVGAARRAVGQACRGEHVAVLVRLLSLQDVSIRVSRLSVPAETFLDQGSRAMLQAAQKQVHVHISPPLQTGGDSDETSLTCSSSAALLLEATRQVLDGERQQGRPHDKDPDGSWLLNLLLRAFLGMVSNPIDTTLPGTSLNIGASSLVSRHCQFRLTTASRASQRAQRTTPHGLDAWWRMFPNGFSGVQSHTSLRIDDTTGVPTSLPIMFDAECHITRRLLGDPVCVGVQSSGPDTDVEITTSLRLDIFWLLLVGLLVIVTSLRPVFLRNGTLQLVLCFVLGVAVLLCIALFYIAKDLHRTRIGKVGIVAMIASGGVVLAVEGLASALIALATHELRTNHLFHGVVAVAGLTSAVLSKYLFASILGDITWVVFSAAQMSLFVAMCAVNAEATVIAVAALAAFHLRVIPMLSRLASGVVRCFVIRPMSTLFRNVRGDGYDLVNDPTDDVTVLDANYDAPYRRPLAASSCASTRRNTEDRFAAYEKEGSEHTRKALDELAATVRARPEKYAHRVRDPNGLARFAGVGV